MINPAFISLLILVIITIMGFFGTAYLIVDNDPLKDCKHRYTKVMRDYCRYGTTSECTNLKKAYLDCKYKRRNNR